MYQRHQIINDKMPLLIIVSSPAELDALLRRLRARQREVREILCEEGMQPLRFVGSCSPDEGAASLVKRIRSVLGFGLDEQKRAADSDVLFRILRARLESVGIFVQVAGDLGSHHTSVEPEVFRGVALSDDIAPFVIVNAQDARAAFPFTLIHEAAHIWLGESGISNATAFVAGTTARRVEQVCNEAAAEFLLPQAEFLGAWRACDPNVLANSVAGLAKEWSVSRAAVAHRLWRLGEIPDESWWGLYRIYQDEWRRRRDRLREKGGGPTYYTTTKSRLGSALIRTVLGAVDAGTVTYTQAARILNVKAKSFDGLRDGGP